MLSLILHIFFGCLITVFAILGVVKKMEMAYAFWYTRNIC